MEIDQVNEIDAAQLHGKTDNISNASSLFRVAVWEWIYLHLKRKKMHLDGRKTWSTLEIFESKSEYCWTVLSCLR